MVCCQGLWIDLVEVLGLLSVYCEVLVCSCDGEGVLVGCALLEVDCGSWHYVEISGYLRSSEKCFQKFATRHSCICLQ